MINLRSSDVAALQSLISRLNTVEVQSRDDAFRKEETHRREVIARMFEGGGSFGNISGSPAILSLDQEAFTHEMKSIADDLGEQVKLVSAFVNQWFDYGEIPPPAWPWRVCVILRKAKRFDLERAFLLQWTRHFDFDRTVGATYGKLADRAAKIGIQIEGSAQRQLT